MSSVLTWGSARGVHGRASSRLQAVQASPHAMWNYVTYRDAIGVLGLDPDEIYPEGATRLDPARWVDLGWLTCFAGPPESAVTAMREAVSAEALNQYPPDLLEPLREEAARFLRAERGPDVEVIGTAGAQEGISLSLMATVDTGDEVIVSDPATSMCRRPCWRSAESPSGFRSRLRAGFDWTRRPSPPGSHPGPAGVIIDPVNPYGTDPPPAANSSISCACGPPWAHADPRRHPRCATHRP